MRCGGGIQGGSGNRRRIGAHLLRTAKFSDLQCDAFKILNWRTGSSGDANGVHVCKERRVGEPLGRFNLHGTGAANFTEAGELLGVGTPSPADNDHELDLARDGDRVLLPPNGDGAHRVDDFEFVAARDKECGKSLKFPWRLR